MAVIKPAKTARYDGEAESFAAVMEMRARAAHPHLRRANVRVTYSGGAWFSVLFSGGLPSKYRRAGLIAWVKQWEGKQ